MGIIGCNYDEENTGTSPHAHGIGRPLFGEVEVVITSGSLMPLAVFLYCLFGKGLLFNGRAGVFYALQRMVAEAALSLIVLEEKLRNLALRSAGHGPAAP